MATIVINELNSDTEASGSTVDLPNHGDKVAEGAYYKAESRGFEPGHELDDWLEAEREFKL